MDRHCDCVDRGGMRQVAAAASVRRFGDGQAAARQTLCTGAAFLFRSIATGGLVAQLAEAAVEILDQIDRILETDVQADEILCGRLRCGAIGPHWQG